MKELTDQQKIILHSAIIQHGTKKQILKAIEELSELTRELARELTDERNHENTIDEIADVEIMIRQVKMILGKNTETKVNERIDFKIGRLDERLKTARKFN
jgi:NTP pyrophosphatase (non-canonical NTP hydrolase)